MEPNQTVAGQNPRPTCTPINLFRVNQVTRDDQLSQLKFFAILMGASIARIEKANRVQQVHEELKGRYNGKQADALLQAMLRVIDVNKEKVDNLGSPEVELRACERMENFNFGSLLIKICSKLEERQFTQLKELFRDDCSEPTFRIHSADRLFLTLYRARKVVPEDVKLLKNYLDELKLERCVSLVEEYQKQTHGIAQESSDQGNYKSSLAVGINTKSTTTRGEMVGCSTVLHRHDDNERDLAGNSTSTAEVHACTEANSGSLAQYTTQKSVEEVGDGGAQSDSSKQHLHSPYERTRHKDRTMKHKPKLKLYDEAQKKLVLKEITTHEVQMPSSKATEHYAMKSREHGVALIVNIKKYERTTEIKEREGTDIDERNLVETFCYLGYRVDVRRDYTKPQIEEIFDGIDSLVKDSDDSFICCILSHGGENVIFGRDGNPVKLRTEEDSLEMKLTKCQALRGKPKMFFVSACRIRPKRTPQLDGESDNLKRCDFGFYYSTNSWERSIRYPDSGTIYIGVLCQVLCEHATNDTLHNILLKVTSEVKKIDVDYEGEYFNQVPDKCEQMTKNVYFFDDQF